MSIARQLHQSDHSALCARYSAVEVGTAAAEAFSQRPQPAPASSTPSGITELVLTQHSPDTQMLLLPMLAYLSSNNDRWITWISDAPVDRNVLAAYGVDTHKIRVIRESSEESTRWILWEALSAGTSHTVIATLSDASEETVSHLESAAQEGNSHGLLIRYR
ncbi:hypothetical protein G8770_21145 [Aestuariicella hydrocarbonica]|uniref:Cell division inhibitor SulA n=1 Tax=Pseudomaricurvus hydrocarbonicus TaxID=1470433 RepID=A0A9E5MPQ0_9GAMM|nr:SulA-like leucine-rich domain-containing protein [Aestuariicella hydrocarbonica]NHO68062.1 hypothetical protein [Aestuariicella hydrocarbonica]